MHTQEDYAEDVRHCSKCGAELPTTVIDGEVVVGGCPKGCYQQGEPDDGDGDGYEQ